MFYFVFKTGKNKFKNTNKKFKNSQELSCHNIHINILNK